MPESPPGWPKRPDGFYTDWETFCTEALTTRMRSSERSAVPTILLAAGASLGATVLVTLARANREVLAELGEEWGIKALPELLTGGGALLGAALGSLGGAMLSRVLSAHADEASVEKLQLSIAAARREFHELNGLRAAGRLDPHRHMAAIEVLFGTLAQA